MDEFASDSFRPEKLPRAIRNFYERTDAYELIVHPAWRIGFHSGARLFKWFSRRIEQMNFPLADEKREVQMESRIIPLNDTPDGRKNVRAWVRIFSETRLPIYVAAYATHRFRDQTYMNIAFPLPFSNMTSILRLYQDGDSLVLTSLSGQEKGDEGVYLVTSWLPVRLPINETIRVWTVDDTSSDAIAAKPADLPVTVIARHDMWLLLHLSR